MNFTLLISLISVTAAGLIGFGTAWNIQGRAIDSLKMEQKDERIALQRAARTQAERHIEKVRVAQDSAQVRLASIVADRKHLVDELDGLRNASEASLRTATSSLDACLASANAFSIVSTQCSERYSSLAGDAQRHVIDKQALIDSWPK